MNEKLDDIVTWIRDMVQSYRNTPIGKGITIEGLRVCDALEGIADRIEAANKRWKEEILGFCNVFTLVYPPDDKDCPVILMGAFLNMCDTLGIEQVKIGGGK